MPGSAVPALGESPSLLAEGISHAWRGRPVLRGLELALGAGEVVALSGANGAGKTTLIRILTGTLEPAAGRVRLGALELAADRRAYLRRVGHVAAGDRGLYARLDVRANLEIAVALSLAPRARRAELVGAALARFELEPLARRRVDRLSMGQRQRVRLAICFAHEPQVALLDEPTTSLDADGLTLLAGALGDLAARGGSGLWVIPTGELPELPAGRRLELTEGALRTPR